MDGMDSHKCGNMRVICIANANGGSANPLLFFAATVTRGGQV